MELGTDEITIDMIDLVIDLSRVEFDMMIQPIIDTLSFDVHMKYMESFVWNRSRHNWYWNNEKDNKEYSFYFCYSLNISESTKNRFRLSYNPNKVPEDDRLLSYLLNIFRFENWQLRIQSFDVAFDYYGITTSDLTFDKGKKRETQTRTYPHSDPTYYIGKSGHGQIKVYDKANEETKNKKELAKHSKTRYEITINEMICYHDLKDWVFVGEVPVLYINQVVGLYDDETIKENDKLLLYAVEKGFPMDKLTYRKRKRYKELMENVEHVYTKIEPSQRQIEMALKEFMLQLIY